MVPTLALYLGAGLVASSLVALIWAVGNPPPADPVRSNLSRDQAGDARQIALTASVKARLVDPILEEIGRMGRSFTGQAATARARRKLELAGLQERGWTVERFSFVQVMGVVAGITLAVVAIWGGVDRTSTLVAVAALAVGVLGPQAWLNQKAEQRQRIIERQLPDVIDQLTVSVEAGLGFDAAMARSAEGRVGPMADELRRVLQDLALGVRRDQALEQLVERTDVADLRQFVMSLRQSSRHGLPISRVLQVQSHELREKRRARVEERAGALPVKIVFPLVFCILPPLFVVILGPAVLDIGESF